MNIKNSIHILLVSSLVVACSKSGGSSRGLSKVSVKDNLESDMKGIYMAPLAPVNPSQSGHLNGSLTVVKEKGDFIADMRLAGGPASILHAQNIHMGSRCPDQSDDLNGDGYIDADEGAKVYKEILIPLDDDLTSQWMGFGTFPVSDEFGNYLWSRTAPYDKMMSDLRDDDINPNDDFAKLDANKTLSVTQRVVVITGVPDDTNLPDTVAARGRMTKQQGLPIACGIIRKVEKTPGVIDNDHTNIPLPVSGEAVGGSGGADDGADFPAQTTTAGSGSGGNYGEDDEVETTNNSTEFGNGGHGTVSFISSDGRLF